MDLKISGLSCHVITCAQLYLLYAWCIPYPLHGYYPCGVYGVHTMPRVQWLHHHVCTHDVPLHLVSGSHDLMDLMISRSHDLMISTCRDLEIKWLVVFISLLLNITCVMLNTTPCVVCVVAWHWRATCNTPHCGCGVQVSTSWCSYRCLHLMISWIS